MLSSEELAARAGVNAAQVRKDLSQLGSYGTRGVGYDTELLRQQINRQLGLNREHNVAVIGAGNLGQALGQLPWLLRARLSTSWPPSTPTRPSSAAGWGRPSSTRYQTWPGSCGRRK